MSVVKDLKNPKDSNKLEAYKPPRYPTVCITDKNIPELSELKVGDKISLITLFRVHEKHEEKDGSRFTLEVMKVAEDSGMKMESAIKKAFGQHKELDFKEEDEESPKHEAGETAEEESKEDKEEE